MSPMIFEPTADGYAGRVRLFGIDEAIVLIATDPGEAEGAPDYRVHLDDEDGPDIGGGWKRVGERAGDYIALEIDSPLFGAARGSAARHGVWRVARQAPALARSRGGSSEREGAGLASRRARLNRMTVRNVLRREVSPSGTFSTDTDPEPFDLRWAAWGAAVETLQIDLVAAGWMSLFDALLEPPPELELRWRASGPGTNAEIKRAYSALFGRFFGRGILRRDHGCRWLRQVRHGLELAPGIYLRRRAGYDGDLPDWVGWDDLNDCVVVAEAKGSHDRGNWHSTNPPPIRTALAQLERVEVVDSSGSRIHFKAWAVACRWGTVANGVAPTIITCDPDARGRTLEPEEARRVREEMRARWNADLLDGLGRPDVAQLTRTPNLDSGADLARDLTAIPGRKGYGALAVEAGGVIPLVGAGRGTRFRALVETARGLKRATALILLDRNEAERAIARADPIDLEVTQKADIDGSAKPEVPDEITVDGVTFRPTVDDIDFLEDVETS